MERWIIWGRAFFGAALIGIGIQQFIFTGFRPFLIPIAEWLPAASFWVTLSGVVLVVTGGLIIWGKKGRTTASILGAVLLGFFLLIHVPYQLQHNPEMLGAWTNALKCSAFAGGAFITAASFPASRKAVTIGNSLTAWLNRLISFGRILFAITMILFGIDHFLYTQFVATLVPAWIPGAVFWTYVAAIALIGAGVAIILKIRVTIVAALLAIMLFIWVIVLHIPRAIADPNGANGNEITSVFQALAFAGIALVLAGLPKTSLVFNSSMQTASKKELAEMDVSN